MSTDSPVDGHRTTVLVIDDDEGFQETIARYLKSYRRLQAFTGWQGMERLRKHHVDVVLLDMRLPDTEGLILLDEILGEGRDVEVLVMTSHAELALAVQAVKKGAFDFLAKSLENYQQIETQVERALVERRRRRSATLSRADDDLREQITLLERTPSPSMSSVIDIVRSASQTPLTILLEGESGVGKEVLARYVHLGSARPGPFVPVNMAAVPPSLLEATLFGHEKGAFTGADKQRLGKFELADGGTLFLDEIGELDTTAQAKLLRVIQERQVDRIGGAEPAPVDVRLIAATNRNLEQDVIQGRFREDLWYRLNVVRVRIPPLRERREDLPSLVDLLSRRAARVVGREPPRFTPEALEILSAHRWPGNVRELENLMLRLVALRRVPVIEASDIPIEYCVDHLGALALASAHRDKIAEKSLYDLATHHFEQFFVQYMVERCDGNKAEAARRLGVSYATVKNKLARSV